MDTERLSLNQKQEGSFLTPDISGYLALDSVPLFCSPQFRTISSIDPRVRRLSSQAPSLHSLAPHTCHCRQAAASDFPRPTLGCPYKEVLPAS